MSRASFSLPTATANTGIFSAFSPSSALAFEFSLVSAPSEMSNTPATGSPASSSRTPSSAAPSLVCEPLNVSSFAAAARVAVDENRKILTRKRSDSDFISGPVGIAELLTHELRARLASPVRNLHAARVVHEHGHDVLLRHRGAHHERGPEETEEHQRQRGHAESRKDDLVAQTPLVHADATIGDDRDGADDGNGDRRHQGAVGDVEAELTLIEDDRPIREQGLKQGV